MIEATAPLPEEKEDLLLSCRYGDLDDVRHFVEKYSVEALTDVYDDNGNTPMHMVCGNGHEDVLDYLLALPVPPSLLSATNSAQSSPLHWAALNAHLAIAQKLVRHPDGCGIDLIDAKNAAGRTPLGEAETAGWDEGARWFVEVMNLDTAPKEKEGTVGEDMDDLKIDAGQGIEVEIEDANGQIAKMSIPQKDVEGAKEDS
ncbi:ankyrin repeat-containing domain protein [Phellopilus nigrolimitatus]|nr:ankyrin repeat-containing domain protein [Phellopilus nigrolimitatus]